MRRAARTRRNVDDGAVVPPALYINGHFLSSELHLTGRIRIRRKKGTFVDIRHNERSYADKMAAGIESSGRSIDRSCRLEVALREPER